METGMLCTINRATLHSFMKNMQIGYSGAACHITNDITSLYDVTNINKLVHGHSDNMLPTKVGKLQMKVHQVDGDKKLHLLWPVKYCKKAGVSLCSLCELLQGRKILSSCKSNTLQVAIFS